MNTFMGFGDVAVQSTAVAQPSTWDKISNILTNVVQPAANIYGQIKSGSSSPASSGPQQPAPFMPGSPQNPGPAAEQPDNTKKYLLVGGAALLATIGILFVVTKKEGKK